MSDVTDAAREAGRELADEWMQENGGPQTTGHHIAHASIVYGFCAGVEWAVAQEPSTDELVDAIEDRLYASMLVISAEDPAGDPVAIVDAPLHEVLRSTRAALEAARGGRDGAR